MSSGNETLASKEFLAALYAALWFETGGLFDPADPECINGTNRRKCGTSGGKDDKGGNTKYGIAAASHPDVDIDKLDLAGASKIYWSEYWLNAKCDHLPVHVGQYLFDVACNSGVGAGIKILQRAVAVADDGIIGTGTLLSVNCRNADSIVEAMRQQRHLLYDRIAQRDPTQLKFVNGWKRRADTFMVHVGFYASRV